MKFLILIFPILAWAGFSDLPKHEKYQYKDQKKVIRPKNKKIIRIRSNPSNNLKKLEERILQSSLMIESLMKKQQDKLIIRKMDDRVKALTRIKGVILNSVLAMNIRPTTFLVRLQNNEYFGEDAELRCVGISFQKRVPAKCDLLVTDSTEYMVDVKIWDLDGAEGVISDYFYSGEEKSFLSSSFVSFFQGVLDATKDRVLTPFGDAERSNAKNKVLSGLVNIGSNANNKIAESMEKKISIAFINAGKEVLAFFNKGINLKEVNR